MSHLPANLTARRREEHARQRARLEAIDAKADRLVKMMTKEVGASPSLFPTEEDEVSEEDVTALAKAIALGEVSLPRGAQVGMVTSWETEVGVDGRRRPRATSLAASVQLQGGETFTVLELLESRLMVGKRWARYGPMGPV